MNHQNIPLGISPLEYPLQNPRARALYKMVILYNKQFVQNRKWSLYKTGFGLDDALFSSEGRVMSRGANSRIGINTMILYIFIPLWGGGEQFGR